MSVQQEGGGSEEGGGMAGWIEMFRGLGESLIEVLRAEVSTLQEDLARSGRHLGTSLGLLGVALILLFWIIGLLIFVLIALLAIWLPLWAASLVILVTFVLGAGLLTWLGLRRMRRVENPMQTVRRRFDDHLDWWQSRLLQETRAVDVTPSAVAGGPEEGEVP